jgi:hypothetical protein
LIADKVHSSDAFRAALRTRHHALHFTASQAPVDDWAIAFLNAGSTVLLVRRLGRRSCVVAHVLTVRHS